VVGSSRKKKVAASGKAAPRHATIRDIARAAGVSETTVSLAFQPSSRISHKTRERILALGNQLHYLPNLSARTLRIGRSGAIGFLVNDITNPYYALMVRSAELIAQQRGYQVVFAECHWDPAREVRAVESMIRSRVQGVLVCSCEKTRKGFELLAQYSIPSVVVDTAPEDYRGALVGNNLVAAGQIAAKHLVDVGCRHVALLTADRPMSSFSAFQCLKKGFLGTLGQHGLDPKGVMVVNAGLTIDQGKYGFELLVSRAAKVDGILCVNDLSAIGVIEGADAKGIRVGPDLAVIGIDDLAISGTARISLTTIRQPNQRIVELAVNTLVDRIESQDEVGIRMLLDPELIVRNSTRRKS
jgi:LacI family transcriptional regulator